MAAGFPLLCVSSTLCFLFLFHGCVGVGEQQQSLGGQQVQHKLQARSECQIESLNLLEPSLTFQSEAGVSEFWDQNNKEFVCAGVEAVRNTVQPKGLLLPHYNNAPQLIYIVQGRGIQGTVIPGCAETYETGEERSEGDRVRRFVDRHQKIRRFHQGDVIALPAGVVLWFYNDGEEPIVSVSLLDTSNQANQLDRNFRDFFLAGNPKQGQKGQETYSSSNIFNGFDDEILANAFNVETETIKKLRGESDRRGRIVRAERLSVTAPQYGEEEQEGSSNANGLEETICSMKLTENIDNPKHADVYNPHGGRINILNSQRLPILNRLQLSAKRAILYKNAITGPAVNQLAHSIYYVTKGSGRVQVVGNTGKLVFDDKVREGQMILVPQGFAVIVKSSGQGMEWVGFLTNEFPSNVKLAGRASAIRAIPEEVLMNSYGMSREEAKSLKYNRDEYAVFSPGSRSTRD